MKRPVENDMFITLTTNCKDVYTTVYINLDGVSSIITRILDNNNIQVRCYHKDNPNTPFEVFTVDDDEAIKLKKELTRCLK
jgi:hypothetical protein